MPYFKKLTLLTLLLITSATIINAEEMLERYQRADQFMPKNITKLVKNIWLRPHWVENGASFWYSEQTDKGNHYKVYNARTNKTVAAFDHIKMAKLMSTVTSKEVKPDSITFSSLNFDKSLKSINFKNLKDTICTVDLKSYVLTKKAVEKGLPKHQSQSPDKKWIVTVKAYNLYLTNKGTGEEIAITADGTARYDYGTPHDNWNDLIDIEKGEIYDPSLYVSWSEDSKKFITYRLNRKNVGKMYLYKSMPDSGFRAKVYSYDRALPGEKTITYEFFSFDLETKNLTKIEVAPIADVCIAAWPQWHAKGSEKISLAAFARGYQAVNLYLADANTGKTTTLLHEKAQTMLETQLTSFKWTGDKQEEFFYTSERNGWNHIYRYNSQGELINQVTKGDFVVRKVEHIDKKTETLYFTASGKDKSIDPYFKQLYSIQFDGTNMQLLTHEKADHNIAISPDGKIFTDNFSTINTTPKSIVRRLKEGKFLKEPLKADISKLLATGWNYPEPFKVKARDGKTDIYGAIFYPSDFDPNKLYPIIDGTYSGPQAVRTGKSFDRTYRAHDVALAELGFIVITIDGLGSAMRSKAFHDVSYKNLGDIGAPDHIKAITDLAKNRAYMDTTRVGIYGHSAGGYDAVRALLTHPEFYKVGVSSAGNHDHRIAKAWWPEQYMGPLGKHYDEQSNFALAANLEGKLLLMHGDLDNNVNPTSSLRMAGELIKQNKDFDLLIFPNKNHGSVYNLSYFQRKRWDYFVVNLLGATPPKQYKISNYE